MKSVLIGTDLLYDKEENLRVLEINSNIGIHTKSISLLNWDSFVFFLQEKNIKNVHLIYGYINIVGEYRDGFQEKMKQVVNQIGLNYYEHIITTPDVVPHIIDNDETLIIRLSFDAKALIDKFYTADKIKFLNIIKEKPYGCNYFYNSSLSLDFNYDGLNTLYKNESFVPNYIEKKRYPHNKMNLFQFKNQEQLNYYKDNSTYQTYLQEFYFNNKNLIKNKMSVIRSVDMIFGDNLDVFHFGMYKTSGQIPFNIFPTEYNEDGSMKQKSLDMWFSKSHVWDNYNYFLDNSSLILDQNGNKLGVNEIEPNILLKTIDFDWISEKNSSEFHIELHTGSYNNDKNSFLIDSNYVSSLIGRYIGGIFFKITLQNGLEWEDLVSSVVLVEENDKTYFKKIKNLNTNNNIVLYSNKENKIFTNKIEKIIPIFKQKQIYSLETNESDLYLPVVDNNNEFSIIKYNEGGSKPV